MENILCLIFENTQESFKLFFAPKFDPFSYFYS